MFIDSSHQYRHTKSELALWYSEVAPGGFLILHDVSRQAAEYDSTRAGGVYRAVDEWRARLSPNALWINDFVSSSYRKKIVYLDGCGLGLIQKPGEEIREGRDGHSVGFIQQSGEEVRESSSVGSRMIRRVARALRLKRIAGRDKQR